LNLCTSSATAVAPENPACLQCFVTPVVDLQKRTACVRDDGLAATVQIPSRAASQPQFRFQQRDRTIAVRSWKLESNSGSPFTNCRWIHWFIIGSRYWSKWEGAGLAATHTARRRWDL